MGRRGSGARAGRDRDDRDPLIATLRQRADLEDGGVAEAGKVGAVLAGDAAVGDEVVVALALVGFDEVTGRRERLIGEGGSEVLRVWMMGPRRTLWRMKGHIR